jgi:hypothetical protein
VWSLEALEFYIFTICKWTKLLLDCLHLSYWFGPIYQLGPAFCLCMDIVFRLPPSLICHHFLVEELLLQAKDGIDKCRDWSAQLLTQHSHIVILCCVNHTGTTERSAMYRPPTHLPWTNCCDSPSTVLLHICHSCNQSDHMNVAVRGALGRLWRPQGVGGQYKWEALKHSQSLHTWDYFLFHGLSTINATYLRSENYRKLGYAFSFLPSWTKCRYVSAPAMF